MCFTSDFIVVVVLVVIIKIVLIDLKKNMYIKMIDARANNIKSGWKSIFAVFRAAASDPEEAIVVSYTIVAVLYIALLPFLFSFF
jgi:F0F1-type ATP synthase membrane subunit b/b'